MKLNKLYVFALALGLTAMVSCGGKTDKAGSDSTSTDKKEETSGPSPLVGLWKVSGMEIADMPKLTPEQQKEMDKQMQLTKDSSSFEVKADGTYHNVNWAGKKYHSDGTWKLSDDSKLLFLTTKRDSTSRLDTAKVVTLSASELVLDIQGNKISYKK